MDVIFEELLLYSFNYLALYDLLHAEQVCKKWQRIAKDTTLWRHMSGYSFIQRALSYPDSCRKEVFVKSYRQAQSMWRGQCTVTTIQSGVAPILGASKEKNLFVTGSQKKLLIWNLDKMTRVDTIEDDYEHDFGGNSKRLVAFKRGKIIYSSTGNTVSIYNIASKRKAGVLVGHTNKISAMNWDNPSLLCTGSRDGTVKFWDTRTFTCSTNIDLGERVRAVRPLDGTPHISSIAYGNGSVAFFDIRNAAQPFEYFNVEASDTVTGMKITSDCVLYTVNHLFLYKYCLSNHTTTPFTRSFTLEDAPMSVMTCNESTVMIGHNDGHIRVHNIEDASYLYSLRVGRDYVKVICLMSDEQNLVYGLDNGLAGVCNFEQHPPPSSCNPTNLPTSGTGYAPTPVVRTFYDGDSLHHLVE